MHAFEVVSPLGADILACRRRGHPVTLELCQGEVVTMDPPLLLHT